MCALKIYPGTYMPISLKLRMASKNKAFNVALKVLINSMV